MQGEARWRAGVRVPVDVKPGIPTMTRTVHDLYQTLFPGKTQLDIITFTQ